jgi:hypothetical protein
MMGSLSLAAVVALAVIDVEVSDVVAGALSFAAAVMMMPRIAW